MSLRRGIVDSTGAGDAYIGGFLAGLLNNFELEVGIRDTYSFLLNLIRICGINNRHAWRLVPWSPLESLGSLGLEQVCQAQPTLGIY